VVYIHREILHKNLCPEHVLFNIKVPLELVSVKKINLKLVSEHSDTAEI